MMHNPLDTLKAGPLETGAHELLLTRWSPRAFSDKAVSAADLQTIFTAASWAASSHNEQPWRFILGRKGDSAYQNIFDCLFEGNKVWASAAPVLILTVAKKTLTKTGADNYYALHDTGAASAQMALQANGLGLYMHGMGGFNHALAVEKLALPADYQPAAVWALGYLGETQALPEPLQAIETSPRQRKSLAELVLSDWNTAATF